MHSTGWKAKEFPIVFWEVPIDAECNPQRVAALDAEVELPDGVRVMVENVRYHGQDGCNHRWQGSIKPRGIQ